MVPGGRGRPRGWGREHGAWAVESRDDDGMGTGRSGSAERVRGDLRPGGRRRRRGVVGRRNAGTWVCDGRRPPAQRRSSSALPLINGSTVQPNE